MIGAPRAILLGLMAAWSVALPARAQTVVTPLLSANVNTSPGFLDLDDAASRTHIGGGVVVSRLTDGWFGVEGEAVLTPSAFSGGDLVESSRLLTATGSVLVMFPERWRMRLYVSLGAGVGRIKSVDVAELFVVDSTQAMLTAGAGGWIWLSPRAGIRTSIRFLRSVSSVESAPLETWQPSVGVSIRF